MTFLLIQATFLSLHNMEVARMCNFISWDICSGTLLCILKQQGRCHKYDLEQFFGTAYFFFFFATCENCLFFLSQCTHYFLLKFGPKTLADAEILRCFGDNLTFVLTS